MDALTDILNEIRHERAKQDTKWGTEDFHPNIPPAFAMATPEVVAEALGVPTADQAREAVERNSKRQQTNWAAILIEEVAEAVEAAALGDEVALQTELVQVAATAVKWIERNRSRPAAGPSPGAWSRLGGDPVRLDEVEAKEGET